MNTTLSKTIDKLPLTRTDKTNLKAGLEDLVNGGGSSSNLIKVTWKELKALRDNSQLIPGRYYRMTDYECIVAPNTEYKSAGHKFDLVLLATDVNKLSENCKACKHEGDTYFPEDTNFEAWEVKYCLDNDSSRFDWTCEEGIYVNTHIYLDLSTLGQGIFNEDAILKLISTNDTTIPGFPNKTSISVTGITINCYIDTINTNSYNLYVELPNNLLPPGYPNLIGPFPQSFAITTINIDGSKGVIYELKDERNNICNYDFKNILYTRHKIKSINIDLNDVYPEQSIDYTALNGFYTFKFQEDSLNAINIQYEDKAYYFYTFCMYDVDNDIPYDTTTNSPFVSVESRGLPYRAFNVTINSYSESNIMTLPNNVFIQDTKQSNYINNQALSQDQIFIDSQSINNTFGCCFKGFVGKACRANVIRSGGDWKLAGNCYNIYTQYLGNTKIGFNCDRIIATRLIENSIGNQNDDILCKGNIVRSNIGNCNNTIILFSHVSDSSIGNKNQSIILGNGINKGIMFNGNKNIISEGSFAESIIDNGCEFLNFKGNLEGSHIFDKIKGTSANIIDMGGCKNIHVSINSSGKIVKYNPADLAPESSIIQ